jgi:hypothetical protein
VDVVIEITAQKQARRDERCDHRRAVLQNRSALNEVVSDGQEHGRDAVQSSVDGRKDAVVNQEIEEFRN